MSIRIATWNINSIRLRIALVQKLAKEQQPDIICIQETKCPDDLFPLKEIEKAGYKHNYYRGEKGYNGVSIHSKTELSDIEMLDFGGNEQTRHISAVLPNGTRLHNFYIPAGGDEPDPEANPAFAHKLKFVEDMIDYFAEQEGSHIIVGDFNIAPLEHDVWSHKQLLKVICHTPYELERIEKLRETMSWVDSSRHFTPEDEKLYSWWSYRNRDWRKSNRGRRLDHIWVTPNLKDKLLSNEIFPDARDWRIGDAGPSDHVPVITTLRL